MTPELTTVTTKRRGRYNNGRAATDCAGKTFGNWTVTERAGSWQGDASWHCVCVCGAKSVKPRRSLMAAEKNNQTYCRECDPRKRSNRETL